MTSNATTMLLGNFGYNGKMKEIEEYKCPVDFIWDMGIPSANCGYDFALLNWNNAESAYIEWGDGTSEYLKCSAEHDSTHSYYQLFHHAYSTSGVYELRFKMNAEYDPATSFFLIDIPSANYAATTRDKFYTACWNYNQLINRMNNGLRVHAKIKAFDIGLFEKIMNFNVNNQALSPFRFPHDGNGKSWDSTKIDDFLSTAKNFMPTHVVHRILHKDNKAKYKFTTGVSFAFLTSDTRDLLLYNSENKNGFHAESILLNLDSFLPDKNAKPSYRISYGTFSGSRIDKLHDLNGCTFASNSGFNGSTLRSVDMSKSVVTTLASRLFQNCTSLSSVQLPSGLTRIETYLLNGCTSLSSIELPSSLFVCYGYSFQNSGIQSIKFKDGLKYIFIDAFKGATSLSSFEAPSSLTGINEDSTGLFMDCNNLLSANFNGAKFNMIPDWFFTNCRSLNYISMDFDNVMSVGAYSFQACSSLTDISFINATYVGTLAFYGCTSLSAANFNSCHTFKNNSFGNTALTSFVFSEECETIGNDVFVDSPLKQITINSIPIIAIGAFNGISSDKCVITVPWRKGDILGAPWCADISKTKIVYLGTNRPAEFPPKASKPSDENLIIHMPLSANFNEVISNRTVTNVNSLQLKPYEYKGHSCLLFNRKNAGLHIAPSQLSDISGHIINHDISLSIWTNSIYGNFNTWSTYVRVGQKTNNQCIQAAGTYGDYVFAGTEGTNLSCDIPAKDKWLHTVITYNETTHKLNHYINGKLVNADVTADLNITMTTSGIVIDCVNANNVYTRYVSDFRVYDCELSQANVRWLYENYKAQEHPLDNEIVYYAAQEAQLYDDTGVDEHTFDSGSGIVAMSNGITSIGQTLRGTTITGVELPDGTTSIEANAFNGCNQLALSELPEELTSIGASAFDGCCTINVSYIPATVSSISEYAFRNCYGLTTVTFISQPSSLATNAFDGCSGLTDIYVPWVAGTVAGAPWGAEGTTIHYAVEAPIGDNQIFYWAPAQATLGNTANVASHTFSNGKGVITYSNDLTTVPSTTFVYCSGITDVELPDCISGIGDASFAMCRSLSSITWPSALTEISGNAFVSCSSLQLSELPNGLVRLYQNAFYNCTGLTLTTLPTTLTTIDKDAFQSCTNITSLTIPSSVFIMGSDILGSNHNLSSVVFQGKPVFIAEFPFGVAYHTLEMSVPWYEEISYYSNENLNWVDMQFQIMHGVLTINYRNVETSMPPADEIWYYAREECTLSASTGIRSHAYNDVTGKGVIKFTSAITEVPSYLFSSNSKTMMTESNLYYLRLPDTIESLAANAFTGSLRNMKLHESRLPNNLKTIKSYAFDNNCWSVTLSALPSGLIRLENWAFGDTNTSSRSIATSSLSTIPASLEYAGYGSFATLFSSTSAVAFEGTPSYISEGAFFRAGVTDIYVPWHEGEVANAPWGATNATVHYAIEPADITKRTVTYAAPSQLTLGNSSGVSSHMFSNGSGTIVFSEKLTEMPSAMFSGCAQMTAIEMPSSVQKLGNSTFLGCESISSIIMPADLTSIGNRCFIGAASLSSVSFNGSSLLSIGDDAFAYNTNLQTLNLSQQTQLSGIGRAVFAYSQLSSIELPDGLPTINWCTFEGSKLEQIEIPQSVSSLNNGAFVGVPLKSITFKESANPASSLYVGFGTAGNSPFYECTDLSSISFPSSYQVVTFVNYYGFEIFGGCSSIVSVEFNGPSAILPNYLFSDYSGASYPSLTRIKLPYAQKELPNYLFYSLPSLKSIDLPDTIETIGNGAFTYVGLTGVVLPSSLKTINNAGFNCYALSSVDASKATSLSSIGNGAFAEAPINIDFISGLTSLKTIGNYAFIKPSGVFNDYEISNVKIPSSVTSIGPSAFQGNAISTMWLDSIPTLDSNAFAGISTLSSRFRTTVSVPWSEGDVAGYPWGADTNYVDFEYRDELTPVEDPDKPDESKLIFNMPFTPTTQLHEMVRDIDMTNRGSTAPTYTTIADHPCTKTPFSRDTTNSFQILYTSFNTTDPAGANYVDVAGKFTLAGWLYVNSSNSKTWYTFMSLGDYGPGPNYNSDITLANNSNNLKVLNLMIKQQGYLGAGSEGVNIGIGQNVNAVAGQITGELSASNSFSRQHWYLLVLTYDSTATGTPLSFWMNRTVEGAEAMTHIGTLSGHSLNINPSTELTLKLGYLKRQFTSEYVHGIKIWQDALTPAQIQWLYEHPSY